MGLPPIRRPLNIEWMKFLLAGTELVEIISELLYVQSKLIVLRESGKFISMLYMWLKTLYISG